MATRGRPISAALIQIIRRIREVQGIRASARETGTARQTVRKYTRPPK